MLGRPAVERFLNGFLNVVRPFVGSTLAVLCMTGLLVLVDVGVRRWVCGRLV